MPSRLSDSRPGTRTDITPAPNVARPATSLTGAEGFLLATQLPADAGWRPGPARCANCLRTAVLSPVLGVCAVPDIMPGLHPALDALGRTHRTPDALLYAATGVCQTCAAKVARHGLRAHNGMRYVARPLKHPELYRAAFELRTKNGRVYEEIPDALVPPWVRDDRVWFRRRAAAQFRLRNIGPFEAALLVGRLSLEQALKTGNPAELTAPPVSSEAISRTLLRVVRRTPLVSAAISVYALFESREQWAGLCELLRSYGVDPTRFLVEQTVLREMWADTLARPQLAGRFDAVPVVACEPGARAAIVARTLAALLDADHASARQHCGAAEHDRKAHVRRLRSGRVVPVRSSHVRGHLGHDGRALCPPELRTHLDLLRRGELPCGRFCS